MHRVFDGRSVPDPGNPKRRRAFWIAALCLIAAVTGLQQYGVYKHLVDPKPVPTVEVPEPKPKDAEAKGPGTQSGEAPKKSRQYAPLGDDLDQADIAGRLMVKIFHVVQDERDREQLRGQLEQQVDPLGQVKTEHAVAILPAYVEIAGVEKGLGKIDALRDRIDDDTGLSEKEKGELSDDLDALTRLYSSGSEKLSGEDRDRIEQRLGWQGRLALTFDKPSTDAERVAMTGNGLALVFLLMLIGLGLLALLPIGLGMFIWAIVLISTGRLRPRLDRPLPGGSIGIEEVVVFLCGFAGLKGVVYLIASAAVAGWFGAGVKADPEGLVTTLALLLQWIILPMVVFYPRLRQYPRFQVKRALGWHRGEGFAKEIACGIGGYLACLPLYVFAAIVTLVLSVIEHEIVKGITGKEPSGPVNPIGGMLAESWWIALLVAVLATVWAPIVEESVFRGALFRQLYARMGLIAAALLSGTVFAMMHGYSPSLFPPLIVLGSGFAIIRWWRGSLVASVTAHALHNGTLMVVMMLLFSLLK